MWLEEGGNQVKKCKSWVELNHASQNFSMISQYTHFINTIFKSNISTSCYLNMCVCFTNSDEDICIISVNFVNGTKVNFATRIQSCDSRKYCEWIVLAIPVLVNRSTSQSIISLEINELRYSSERTVINDTKQPWSKQWLLVYVKQQQSIISRRIVKIDISMVTCIMGWHCHTWATRPFERIWSI